MVTAVYEKLKESKYVENRLLNNVFSELKHLERFGFDHNGRHFTVTVCWTFYLPAMSDLIWFTA